MASINNPSPESSRPPYVSFKVRAVSQPARDLISALTGQVAVWETEAKQAKAPKGPRGIYRRGQKGSAQLQDAIERFVGHLLLAVADCVKNNEVRRELTAASFTGAPVTRKSFQAAREGLKALGYINHTEGIPSFIKIGFDGKPLQTFGISSLFSATPSLLSVVKAHSVDISDIGWHFAEEQEPLQVSTPSEWTFTGDSAFKQQGQPVAFTHTSRSQQLEAEIVALNEFLKGFEVRGGQCFGFYRSFNEYTDVATYNWDKGGRLYAVGRRSYQGISEVERSAMTINGEAIAEIDISASYLTVFHCLMECQLEDFEGLWDRIAAQDRSVVKEWVNYSLSSGQLRETWPESVLKRYREKHGRDFETEHPAVQVGNKALAAFPMLKRLNDAKLNWADLMFAESRVIVTTMLVLKDRGILSLPVHDSLIVPVGKVGEAAGVLYDTFYRTLGLPPTLKPKGNVTLHVEAAVRAALEAEDRYEDYDNL